MLYPNTEDLPDPSLPDEPSKEVMSEIAILKERAMKCKVIALDHLNKPVLANPTTFNKNDKKKILKIMTNWFNKDDDIINETFNAIILGDVLDETSNYQAYTIDGEFGTPLPPPIKKETTNKQTLVKPDDWVDPYPSEGIDPASKSSFDIFSRNEAYEVKFDEDGKPIKMLDAEGKFIDIIVKD